MYSKVKYEDPHILSAFLYANHWSEEVVSRDCLVWFSPLLLLLGIGEVIVSAILIHNSYRYFIGAIYTGIIAIIASAGSIFLKTRFTVFIYLVAITITYVISVIGSIFSIMNFLFLGHIEACASTTGQTTDSCGFNSKFECYGNAAYFEQAVRCEGGYDNTHTTSHYHCSCVLRGDSKDCSYWKHFDDCTNLVDNATLYLPMVVAASFALALTVVSGYAMVIAYVLLNDPESITKWCCWAVVRPRTRSPSMVAMMEQELQTPKDNQLRPVHML